MGALKLDYHFRDYSPEIGRFLTKDPIGLAGRKHKSDFLFTYDNNGNLLEKENKATGEVLYLTYDADNRVISAEKIIDILLLE